MLTWEDQKAIEDLHSRYVHAIDRGDLTMLRSLYTDDATETHGEFSGTADEFIAWLGPILEYFEIATHTISNVLVRGGSDNAQSEARGTAFLRLAGESPTSLIVINRHFDHYRKVLGEWKFTHRNVCVDWAEVMPQRDAPLDLVAPFPAGSPGPNDPVFTNVPDLIAALHQQAGVRD